MHILDALGQSAEGIPQKGTVGSEQLKWHNVAELEVKSGALDVDDLCCSKPPSVAVANSIYLVEAKLIDFAGHLRVSRLRARAKGVDASIGQKIGKLAVEFGAVVLADFQQIRALLTEAENAEFEQLLFSFMTPCDLCRLRFESGTVYIVKCTSGFGDGTYPVFALNAGGQPAGLEVDFIPDGYVMNR
jgi:hypothetical protein